MKTTLKLVKDYINFVRAHRKEHKEIQKGKLKEYSPAVSCIMRLEYTFHDLKKIFTPKIVKYARQHEELIYDNEYSHYHDLLCKHDSWAVMPIIEGRDVKEINKVYQFLDPNNYDPHFNVYDDIVDFANGLFDLCEAYGEDCVSFYLRNYEYFNIYCECDRFDVERALAISFDDYLHDYYEVSIREALDPEYEYYDEEFANHVFYSLLNQYGVNMYDVLGIDTTERAYCDEETRFHVTLNRKQRTI